MSDLNNSEDPIQCDDLNEPLLSPPLHKNASISAKRRPLRNIVSHGLVSIFEIYTNQTGSPRNILSGLLIALILGTILGIKMPKNQDLPTVWYRNLSSVIGYTYFFCWSISFYPQLMINHFRKSVSGLSTDASIMQLLNFASYAAYCSFFFFDGGIRQEYKDRHGINSEIMVSSSDVAFSIHALVMTVVMIGQITYYGGYKTRPISFVTKYISLIILFMCGLYSTLILLRIPGFLWIDFLYILAMVKLGLTITTYIPQLLLNYQRKSTTGFNIWNIILDFSGGFLSLLQLLLDGYDLGDVEGAIRGNWAKALLGLISLFFDSIFFLQHFVLYHKPLGSSSSMTLEEQEDVDSSERIRMV